MLSWLLGRIVSAQIVLAVRLSGDGGLHYFPKSIYLAVK